MVTVFGLIAQPETHIFLKPKVTCLAAEEYGYEFEYDSRPVCDSYANLLEFAGVVRRDLRDLRPRDMIEVVISLGSRLGRLVRALC